MRNLLRLTLIPVVAGALFSCTATHHVKDVRAEDADRVTVGTVQKEIRLGMSGADVAAVLGSPSPARAPPSGSVRRCSLTRSVEEPSR